MQTARGTESEQSVTCLSHQAVKQQNQGSYDHGQPQKEPCNLL